jgi:tetratricopeptide (TPR) repeat protein
MLSLIPWSADEQLERASYFFLLGNGYFQAGNRARAVELFERAARGNPNSWKIRHNLGEAYGAVGRYQAAIDELSAARSLDPGALSTERALAYYLARLRAAR